MGQIETLFSDGRFDEVIPLLEKTLEHNASNLGARHFLGIALVRTGQIEQGLNHIEYTITKDPKNSAFALNYAMVMEDEGRTERAIYAYQRVLDLDPSNDEAAFSLAGLYVEGRRGKDAYEILVGLKERYTQEYEFRILYVSALLLVEDYVAALGCLKEYQQDNPEDIHFRTQHALALSKTGYDEKAKEIFLDLLNKTEANAVISFELASLYERTHDFANAEQWANRTLGFNEGLLENEALLLLAKIYRRQGNYAKVREYLRQMEERDRTPLDIALSSFEIGRVLEKEGRFDEAFNSFEKGNKIIREKIKHLKFSQEDSRHRFSRLEDSFSGMNFHDSENMDNSSAVTYPDPIFIVGFPRSGTTLVEQILASHPNISAGGELKTILDITNRAPEWMHTDDPYPECMSALVSSGRHDVIEIMREYYLHQVSGLNVIENDEKRFTDKMPLNLLHLPVIRAMFPMSPVIHVIRHPLDCCLSAFFSEFSSANEYSFDLLDTAFYFRKCWELAEYYRKELGFDCYRIRYEELVTEPEAQIRSLLEIVSEPWDDQCLEFYRNKRFVRTASYEQVNQKMYTSSLNRYKNYRKQLEPIIPILEPIIEELGYTID